MANKNDYFYNRYFLKDYELPEETPEQIEEQMAAYLPDTTSQPVDARGNALQGLQQALGKTSPGMALSKLAQTVNRQRAPIREDMGTYSPGVEEARLTPTLPTAQMRPIEGVGNYPWQDTAQDKYMDMADADAAVQEALAAYRKKDYSTATNLLRQAQQLSPNYPQINKYLGLAQQGEKRSRLTKRYREETPERQRDPYQSLLEQQPALKMIEERFPRGI